MPERVEAATITGVNSEAIEEIEDRVKCYALRSREDVERRIYELDREWDVEKFIGMKTAFLAIAGTLLGVMKDKRWLILPGISLPYLLYSSVVKRNPLTPLLINFGIRSKKEIELERYAMKAIRGDFAGLNDTSGETDRLDFAVKALNSVER